MKSKQYERAEAMVFADKFGLSQTDFFAELNSLVSRYMKFDGMSVDVERCGNRMIITVSVQKVKPTFRL